MPGSPIGISKHIVWNEIMLTQTLISIFKNLDLLAPLKDDF